MKESRFIELLNLYVDHQLSPSEAAELEAEITRNPDRRRTYQQYCRMQKACTVLFEQERMQAPASKKLAAALRAADRKVEMPESRSRTRKIILFPAGLAGLAAAACIAFVLVRSNNHGSDVPTVAQPAIAAAPVQPTAPAVTTAAAPVVEQKPALASTKSRMMSFPGLAIRSVPAHMTPASDEQGAAPVSYSWMQNVSLDPIQPLATTTRLTLQSQPTASEDQVLRSGRSVNDPTDPIIAFQFQK